MLLTISIPTYNRGQYLNLCLKRIIEQIDPDIIQELEIIVSDNNSVDNTLDIVSKYQLENPNISLKYSKNEVNIGLDGNITQAYKLATGNFVLVFGDDDVLIDGSLRMLINILRNNSEAGVVYIESFGFTNNYYDNIPTSSLGNFWVYSDKYSYVKKINYYFTYTSGNVINKRLIDNKFDINRFLGTNLNLLNWIFTAILTAKYNIYIKDRLIGTKTENTGGYGFCETFAKNGNYVFNSFIEENNVPKKYFDVINNRMLVNYLPYLINLFKGNSKSYIQENYQELLEPIYKNNMLYWLFCYPAIKFPDNISNKLLFFNKWYRRFINMKLKLIEENYDVLRNKIVKKTI